MNHSDLPRLDRRTAIKWMLAASATIALADRTLFAAPANAAIPANKGYGTDPFLNQEYQSGSFWPLTLSDAQRRTAAALCAVIIPAEGTVPSAVDLRVHDFIDEWISAPYPDQKKDRAIVLPGLEWIDGEAQRRFSKNFADLDARQTSAICDDLCHEPDAKPEHATGAKFFAKFRDLTAGGFYSTSAGMTDVGYIGNMPLAEFKGPPPEVLQRLGLA